MGCWPTCAETLGNIDNKGTVIRHRPSASGFQELQNICAQHVNKYKVYYLLFVDCGLLFVVWCLCCLLLVVYCLLDVVCCLLDVECLTNYSHSQHPTGFRVEGLGVQGFRGLGLWGFRGLGGSGI